MRAMNRTRILIYCLSRLYDDLLINIWIQAKYMELHPIKRIILPVGITAWCKLNFQAKKLASARIFVSLIHSSCFLAMYRIQARI